ncbi:hypothetical protein RHMOL_Rhmol01G0100500 [Rhododendron molle]|uniref:Uncharacterized protein n=1 Tax=Rhododendron molle TaxID=49168 RepID=A0ACC0Q0D7_RHOML|nr:hypothetical protein RHMOL_Rhmol01G0100500 [Rhododendron molle]
MEEVVRRLKDKKERLAQRVSELESASSALFDMSSNAGQAFFMQLSFANADENAYTDARKVGTRKIEPSPLPPPMANQPRHQRPPPHNTTENGVKSFSGTSILDQNSGARSGRFSRLPYELALTALGQRRDVPSVVFTPYLPNSYHIK